MFVQCAKFVERHHEKASHRLSVFGTEKTEDTVILAKMNLALHGLSGDIRQANSYYEDPYKAVGSFDFVMAKRWISLFIRDYGVSDWALAA